MNFIDLSTSRKAKATRSSLACLPCRSRHLKCGGERPCCCRCAESGNQCHYAKSRRGGLDRAALAERRKRLAATDAPSSGNSTQTEDPHDLAGVQQNQSHVYQFTEANVQDTNGSMDEGRANWRLDTDSLPSVDRLYNIDEDALIDSYYANFHSFHPLLLPRKHLARLYQDPDKQASFIPLVGVMRLIGHLYASREWSTSLEAFIDACLLQASQADPVMVQCRLLYSIALFWHARRAESKREMSTATRLALDLGMFRREFATEHGPGDPVLAESWRRTWWMLYIVDVYYAGTVGEKDLAVLDVEPTVDLPCEESEYEFGEVPESKTLHEFDCREFALDSTSFSSFAYLVGAARCAVGALASAQDKTTKEVSPQLVCAADSALDGWLLLLPKDEKQVMDKSGNVDELMFQAELLIHVANIGMHRPFSDLKFNVVEDVSSCARQRPPDIPTPEHINVHTVRVLRSVEAQIRLLALPARPFRHTPFTTCMISEGTLALLSACTWLLKGKELAAARDQIRMTIGCLRALGEVWPRIARNLQELQTIARHALGLEEVNSVPSVADVPSLLGSEEHTAQESETGTSSNDIPSYALGSLENMYPWYSLCDLGLDDERTGDHLGLDDGRTSGHMGLDV